MKNELGIIKGIHPGFILERELNKRHLAKCRFAISIQEHPQTICSIIKGKRKINPGLSLKIGNNLGLEEEYFMILQTYYDIEEVRQKLNNRRPDFTKLRRVIFWDTKIENINWEKYKSAVVKRVFERGNDIEKKEISRFYGKKTVNKIIHGQEK